MVKLMDKSSPSQLTLLEIGIKDVSLGSNVKLVQPVNLYGCEIGDQCFVGPFVEIQREVRIGARTKVQSHTFVCELVTIGDDCFIGHGVMFINDSFSTGGPAQGRRELWSSTRIGNRVSIGSNATIMPVTVCDGVVIGAGAVVTRDILEPGVYAGNPARRIKSLPQVPLASLITDISPMTTVPFADLHAQYLSIKSEIDTAIATVIHESAFIRGPYVDNFERAFAQTLGIEHCISCANGTDAIYIALNALGIRSGDEVITSAHSWISTSESVTQAGGRVVFCDTDRDTFTIDPAQIEAKITPRTVGIIPVHLYGQAADMDPIMEIARKHKLWVIEDCAQAHLAKYKGGMVGTFGNAATFSFYPGKNLGAMGDAGAIVTGDARLAEKMSMFARHGGLFKGDHQIEGINSRLDGLQAAILSAKLAHLPAWTRARQEWAAAYNKALAGIKNLVVPPSSQEREHVYHLYVIRHSQRDALSKHLQAAGVQTVVNYPIALPFLPAYRRFEHRPEEFPNAFAHQAMILSLPLFPEMTAEQHAFVVEKIARFH